MADLSPRLSLIRMVCPVCNRARRACWLCDRQGVIEFCVPEDQVSMFQHDPCIVLRTVPAEHIFRPGKSST